ncbi:hypothetical protein GCM10023307_15600 [Lysobacter hankyongensis]|uniref:X-Tfes XVIPCD domain-containing protein n=2 Tax=Lysobacter hankyongensis TaxID=1176535 RepID=A0ABP9B9N8_9GAMM
MLDAYEHPAFSVSLPREQDTYLRHAIESSPELRQNLLTAIGEGLLERFDQSTSPGAGASYSPTTRAMSIPNPDAGHPMELVFTLGHETQHALDAHDATHLKGTFLPAVDAISRSADRPHDYTDALRGLIEASRESEARAEIGGFNAVISAMRKAGMTVEAADLARTMPTWSEDFLTPRPGDPQGYAWRGLARNADGTLPFSDANVDAMKVNYADALPGTFGANGLLDYRHQALLNGLEVIQSAEKLRYAEGLHGQDAPTAPDAMALRSSGGDTVAGIPMTDAPKLAPPEAAVVTHYRVDFDALGANRALLNVPADGMVAVKDPAVFGFPPFQHDHPDFVVERAQALRNLGLPPDRERPQWVGPPAPPPVPVPETLPEHPLYRQASDGLTRLGPVAALSGPDRHADAAAAIALSAAEQGMTRIDHVLSSRDGNGLIMVQGEDPAAPHARRARVEIADLAPAEQSLERLAAQRQTVAFEPERSFERQQDETRAQGAPAIAPRSL